jgi:glutamine amidotransferase
MNFNQRKLGILKSNFANLYSVQNALKVLGCEAVITDDPEVIQKLSGLIFPGVGSFPQVMSDLHSRNLVTPLKDFANSGKPFLGICLGMQLLFDIGYEGSSVSEGLKLLEGEVIALDPKKAKRIPHIGWNDLIKAESQSHNPIFNTIDKASQVYFVHSYFCNAKSKQDVLAYTEPAEGYLVPAIVQKGNIYGMQFHPERSGDVGLKLLNNFLQNVFSYH